MKQLGLTTAGLGVAWSAPQCLAAEPASRHALPRSTPEAQGVSSAGILAFLDAVAQSKHEFHSLMLVRHGYVIAEGWWQPYRPAAPHMLYSLSKSFTSTAIGLAVGEGRLTVNDRVVSIFPNELPSTISEHLAALRVKDLLTMSVGHDQDSTGSLWAEENWVRKFLSLPIPNAPGTKFLYNSGATYMLSAIVQQVTGQTLVDYLTPRLFTPLGVQNPTWETCPRGINTGGWGLKLPTEALAKFGQLYLQHGLWKGRQILPAAWVDEATSFKIQQPAPDLERAKAQSDWHQGYCYQFWRCRHNAFRGDGAFGQFTVVMPEQDAVLVITSETSNMQGELDLVYAHLLPAMESHSLPAAKPTERELKKRLGALALLPPKGQPGSPVTSRVSGRHFQIQHNAAGVRNVSLQFHSRTCRFTLEDAHGDYSVECGLERWVEGQTAMPGTPPKLTQGKLPAVSKVAASGRWKDDTTFEMTWRFYETPHHDTVTCRFDGDQLKIEFLDSLAAMAPNPKDKRPPLLGQLAGK